MFGLSNPQRFMAFTGPLAPVLWAAAGVLLAVGTWRVDLFDAGTGRPVGTRDGHRGWVTAVRFTPDGRHLVSGSADGTAVVWSVPGR